jgi:hypothetical protein
VPVGKDATPGYEIVPTEEARALVAYLMSQREDVVLYETPPPKTNKVAAAASTNAPTGTNAPEAGAAAPGTNSPTTNSPGK